jgi:NAD(P)-dependent dehydrogenase (short-subunit alcohol dehydrogenase family)
MSGKLLQERVAIVTGGGSGIGQAICAAFAREGAITAVLDMDGDAAKSVATSIGGLAVTLDVSDPRACAGVVQSVTKSLGPPTILVCSAAYFAKRVPLADLADDVWERCLSVNIGGHFNMSKQCIPHMVAAGGGSIVHISSIMARVANFGQTAYCATKGALTMLSKGIALDYAKDGIRSNTLMPGGIATQGMADLYGGDMARAEADWGAIMHPIGRLGQVEEIADAALFLASDRSSFITGVDLPVEGGYSIR